LSRAGVRSIPHQLSATANSHRLLFGQPWLQRARLTDYVSSVFRDLRPVDVFAAARRLSGVAHRTPLRHSAALSARSTGDVLLKLENEQITGSFKLRGAYNAIATLPESVRSRGVIAASAGNHGLGVASASRMLGVAATVYVPCTAPDVKRKGIASLGATVDATAPDYDAAFILATSAAREHERAFIDPCAGDALIAGQGTIALEVVQELPEVTSIVVPVGGAGLLAGIASFLRAVAPQVHIVGVQSENTAAMARSLDAGRVVPIPSVPTLADGLAGGIDELALDVGRHALDAIVLVTEEEIEHAIAWLAMHEGVVAEGAAAVSVAAILAGKLPSIPTPAVMVITGGNIDPRVHERILRDAERGARTGRTLSRATEQRTRGSDYQ
jgi:threonine dehydratase